MGIKKRTPVGKSHKKISSGKKAEVAPVTKSIMAKMIFDQDHFEDQASVQEWLDKAEWDAESITIADDGEGSYVARPEGMTDADFTRLMKVDAEEEGVSAYVGEIIVKDEADDDEDEDEADADADEDDGDEDDADTEAKGMKGKKKPYAEDKDADKSKEAKADDKPSQVTLSKRAEFLKKRKETVAKFSGWDAFYAKKSTLADALKAGMSWDATPPGFYDVQAAFNGVITAVLTDDALDAAGKAEGLQKAAADYADILAGMDTFFTSYIEAGEETVAKAFDADGRSKLEKWADTYGDFLTTEHKVGDAAPVQKEVVKKSAAEPAAIDYNKIGNTIAELVAKAVEPVVSQVSAVSETVTRLADRRPTKKSADLTDQPNGQPEPVVKAVDTAAWARTKQKKGLFG